MPIDWILPDWPAPAKVGARVTTRAGGVSQEPYAELNLAVHVGDAPAAVAENRRLLESSLPGRPAWLEQVHGAGVVRAGEPGLCADASFSTEPGLVCAVLTADCLPVLLCDESASVVAAAHAGWRGLAAGVLERTVEAMGVPPGRLLAWLGPAIGPQAFEVGEEVRAAFMAVDPLAAQAFVPGARAGKWQADLFMLARQRLQAIGLKGVWGGGLCTFTDARRFYSYRRDGVTGRFASLVWIEPGG